MFLQQRGSPVRAYNADKKKDKHADILPYEDGALPPCKREEQSQHQNIIDISRYERNDSCGDYFKHKGTGGSSPPDLSFRDNPHESLLTRLEQELPILIGIRHGYDSLRIGDLPAIDLSASLRDKAPCLAVGRSKA